ncbi:hypothetical protein E4659_12650 [Dickeya dianthicola]|uniref:Uncharacterized protein n=1 Tax=Dickeya dianthicola TaxID=204039 RepID=A0AAX1C082_9GAMM|nr:hypothetical protein [Dickeya dianthicola]MZI91590.1 hypothetical protein [Dickeya dianthicola]PWD68360.1 hypothetical protein DF213_21950 [Dickeya dianthicola]UOO22121.1 hypothetical protein E4659_12650 [Dickeya dianthicola]
MHFDTRTPKPRYALFHPDTLPPCRGFRLQPTHHSSGGSRCHPLLGVRFGVSSQPVTGPQLACGAGAGSAGADGTESASDALRRSVAPTVKAKTHLHDHAGQRPSGRPPAGAARGGDGEHGNEQGACDCEPGAASEAGLGRGRGNALQRRPDGPTASLGLGLGVDLSAEEGTPPPTAEGAALRAAPHPRCRWRGRKT